MDNSITVHSVTQKVPPEAIQDRFGVKERSIRLARERGVFPASWYRGIKELCATYGAGFSDDLFNWKTPKDAENSAHDIKRGNAAPDIQGQGAEKRAGAA
jgi:hypothetical protein